MALSQSNINPSTPMGATLVPGGATFKVWGPLAQSVYLNGTFGAAARWSTSTDPTLQLNMDPSSGYWTGFLPGVADGDQYKYYVIGQPGGNSGYKRDPYARELTSSTTFPFGVNCIARSPNTYPWHDQSFVTPDYSNLIIYQLHIGVFAPATFPNCGTFLDVIAKIPYLVALGVNLLQPLPICECKETPDEGYDGADLFSPDSLYTVYDPTALGNYLTNLNSLLAAQGCAPLTLGQITGGPNQLKALVDLCHVYGIAVAFDVVYNHAGGFVGDDESIYFWDREALPSPATNNQSLFFTSVSVVGGLSFALWKQEVSQFLIDNASFFINEFHVDAFRYDEISLLLQANQPSGWTFCQNLTNTLRYIKDRLLQNAEYWPSEFSASVPSIVQPASQGGAGFDTVQHDALRIAIRGAIQSASYGQSSAVDMDAILGSLYPPGLPQAWNAVPCVENHDVVYINRDVRIPVLADGSDAQSFYARSRSKVATGLLLAAPGIPQIFMGQEFLESRQWCDDPTAQSNLLEWVALSSGNKSMADQLRFTQDFIRLRWNQPALRGQSINPYYSSNNDRVIAFHRWIDGQGLDVVVVASLNDGPFFGYQLGFPQSGRWAELFNSDVYDNWVNPLAVGNNGAIFANGGPLHNLPSSAPITIPPRSILVFGIG
jgi:1,4-alpha-glucan branching enzyme